MTSLSKIVTVVAVGTLLAVGSAVAFLNAGAESPRSGVRFTSGFTAMRGLDCPAGGPYAEAALSFRARWSGRWDVVGDGLAQAPWTSCPSHWAQGYLSAPEAEPSTVAQRVDLSTLPLMR
jgi:hypothetical protein